MSRRYTLTSAEAKLSSIPLAFRLGGFCVGGDCVVFDYYSQHGQPLVTVRQAADMLNVSRETVKAWVRLGYKARTDPESPLEQHHVERVGLTPNGTSLYLFTDLADAEHGTRGRGRPRLVGAA